MHPTLAWSMVSEFVPNDKVDKVLAQWEKNKQGKRASQKASKARKAGKAGAPAPKYETNRPADAPKREDGKAECVVRGCYSRSHTSVGGISCNDCAIEA
mmetsp:Transcript_15049/g.43510  ORF Transcript_15049/g.43510 Transcript_15049/m.43510 type:complete len:99 (-) Transcript_15049:628-924(-)